MPQAKDNVKPLFLNLDSSFETMQKNESPFIKDLQWEINANSNNSQGLGNTVGEGQNELSLTPTRSTVEIKNKYLPIGFNKCVGAFESPTTNELYYLNYNSNGNHGIYIIEGDTLAVVKVIEDEKLNFSIKQESYFAQHRCTLRIKIDKNKNIIEKYFIATNGERWQLWINVIASIKTNGFDSSAFPYWTLTPPLFDRSELLDYPVRPPNKAISFVSLSNVNSSLKLNNMVDTAFELCYQYIYTDGRETIISPISLPIIIQTQSYLSNPNLIPNQVELTIDAGSCMIEQIKLYVRVSKKKQDVNAFVTWSDWYLYDTIFKFNNDGVNSFEIIGNDYWLRQNPFPSYNFDAIKNTIKYKFDNTNLYQIADSYLFTMVSSSMPLRSVALSDLGDAVMLSNNEYGYDNTNRNITRNLEISVVEKDANESCDIPLRKMRLYAYIGRAEYQYLSQVGYTYGNGDNLVRFGGMDADGNRFPFNKNSDVYYKDLNFAGNNALVCYLKGTIYYSVGQWYVSDTDFNLTKITNTLDYTTDHNFITNVYSSSKFFVCVFDFEVPSGKYIATLGRHNIPIDEDFRGQSTYVMGISYANLRDGNNNKTRLVLTTQTYWTSRFPFFNVRPNVPVINNVDDLSKEIEVDCSNGDIDLWGNNQLNKTFFVFCFNVHEASGGEGRWRFVEGYAKDGRANKLGYELLGIYANGNYGAASSRFTDKNGFYWWYDTGNDAGGRDTKFLGNFNCVYREFVVQTIQGCDACTRVNPNFYVTDYIQNYDPTVDIYKIKLNATDVSGNLKYSNISVSIKDGGTVFTGANGDALLLYHAGVTRSVYINAGGDFSIAAANCGNIPLYVFNPSNQPCINRQFLDIAQKLLISTKNYTSLKQLGSYTVGIVLADKALRVTNVNKIADVSVPSFASRNKTTPVEFNWKLLSALNIDSYDSSKEAAYLSFFVTKATNYKNYIQWVGDSITYFDGNANVVTNPSLAKLVSISITSLLSYNIKNNLNILATYQFKQNDRIRIFDDGNGTLLSSFIDVVVEGTNYNQAAVNSNLIAPPTNIVLPSTSTTSPTASLFVQYDSRFDKLKDSKGFWIEIYSPSETEDTEIFLQVEGWMPIVNGEIASFDGYVDGDPLYTYPTNGRLKFWDTYQFNRNIAISNVGSSYFAHPFESPNVTDTWGVNLVSGGNPNVINNYAKQKWYLDDTIKSDDFITEGTRNGLATFRNTNRKSFKGYGRGGIVATKTQYQVVLFICELDWFTTDYNFNYVFANQQGVQIANLDNSLGTPHQKIGDNYGCYYHDTASIVFYDKWAFWHDSHNGIFVFCDFRQAVDITDINSEGRGYGIKSYYSKKTQFVETYNEQSSDENKIEVVTGIDASTNLVYVTFRPRRGNSNLASSYVNDRRNIQLDHQETLVYSINAKRWVRFVGFTPEAYGNVRGAASGNMFISFAASKPFNHSSSDLDKFCNFYGVQLSPIISCLFNANPQITKTLQHIIIDSNRTKLYADFIYSNLFNLFSYIPLNYVDYREGLYFAQVLRNANSYPDINDPNYNDTSMLIDGNKVSGLWFFIRFVLDLKSKGQYFELNNIGYSYAVISNTPTNE